MVRQANRILCRPGQLLANSHLEDLTLSCFSIVQNDTNCNAPEVGKTHQQRGPVQTAGNESKAKTPTSCNQQIELQPSLRCPVMETPFEHVEFLRTSIV